MALSVAVEGRMFRPLFVNSNAVEWGDALSELSAVTG